MESCKGRFSIFNQDSVVHQEANVIFDIIQIFDPLIGFNNINNQVVNSGNMEIANGLMNRYRRIYSSNRVMSQIYNI